MQLFFMTDPAIYDNYMTFLEQENTGTISCLSQENVPFYPEDDPPDPDLIVLCDTDEGIRRAKEKNLPVIAITHSDNRQESLLGAAYLVTAVEALTPDFLNVVLARHRGLPLPVIETGRCSLRELSRDDLPFLLRLQEENADNPSGSFFPPGCGDPQDYLEKYINYQYPFFGFGIYLVLDKESRQPVGIAGYSFHEEVPGVRLHRYQDGQLIPFHIEENDSVVEIGYCISRDQQGIGLASEILPPLISYGTDRFGFDRILAVTERTNTPSIRLAEKNQLEVVFLP